MRTICPKIFAKLYFFATRSQMAVAKNKHNFFRVKDNLAVLP